MNYVLAIVILAIWLAAMLRQRQMLPGIVVATILAANILAFYLIQFLQLADLIHIEHSYKYKRIYLGEEYPFLFTVGGLLVAICVPYIFGKRKKLEKTENINNINTKKSNYPIAVFVIFCFILTIYHAISTNLSFLSEYSIYLQFRDPSNLNIRNDLLVFFHGNMGAIGILLGVIIATSGYRSIYSTFMAIFPYIYILLFQAASISRWVIIQISIPALILAFRSRFRWPIIVAVILLMLPIYSSLRVVREDRVLGFDALVSSVLEGTSVNSDFFVDATGNIFGAGLNISEAQRKVGVEFPVNFTILSFSPLPSSIDGFDNWRHYTQWINIYGPFNVFSELYWMGLSWYILFVILILLAISLNDRVDIYRRSKRITPLLASLSNVLLYYGVLLTTQYPLRSALRWSEISAILAFFLLFRAANARGSSAPRQQGGLPGSRLRPH